jgi:hypothetical protein
VDLATEQITIIVRDEGAVEKYISLTIDEQLYEFRSQKCRRVYQSCREGERRERYRKVFILRNLR